MENFEARAGGGPWQRLHDLAEDDTVVFMMEERGADYVTFDIPTDDGPTKVEYRRVRDGEEPPTTSATPLPFTKEGFTSMVGEGVHTGLRKGSEAPSSNAIWKAINDSKDSAWSDALSYMAWGFEHMGYKFKEGD